jgi:hypothetical protein
MLMYAHVILAWHACRMAFRQVVQALYTIKMHDDSCRRHASSIQ